MKYFNKSFLCINPDTIWNSNYIEELKKLERNFFLNKKKCSLLVVNKNKSFDKKQNGDFNLNNNLITREKGENLNYIYTGLQIIKPEIFSKINEKVFSINKVWNQLILNKELSALESKVDFLHVSNLNIYNKLNIK